MDRPGAVHCRLTNRGLLVWLGQASRQPPVLDFFDWRGGASATLRKFDYEDSEVSDGDDLATLVRLVTSGHLHPEIGLLRTGSLRPMCCAPCSRARSVAMPSSTSLARRWPSRTRRVRWQGGTVTSRSGADPPTYGYVAGRLATSLADVTSDPAALDGAGFWIVVQTFEGGLRCLRFAEVREATLPPSRPWQPIRGDWASSLDHQKYTAAVRDIRAEIAAGEVYQVNLCRRLSTPLPDPPDLTALAGRIQAGNPAPYFAVVQAPAAGLAIVSASPERFLARHGSTMTTQPIKGTAVTAADMLEKDIAENVMIVDMARNDLARIARVGSVDVPELCRLEEHPGLVHLVSTVRAELRAGVRWPEILTALTPAASISGTPKEAALTQIRRLEPVPREIYCGLVGWVDADTRRADLAVGIRTFWHAEEELRFGTGAGITWGSDPDGEWEESALKARRLIGLLGAAP